MDAVVMLDSVGYKFSHKAFGGFFHATNCVATSNWTLPSVVSMLTGKESAEHGVHMRPNVRNPWVGRVVRTDKVRLFRRCVVQCEYPTLFKGCRSLYVCQIPVVRFAFDKQSVSFKDLPLTQPVAETIKTLRPAIRSYDFMFIHLKAAHTPYTCHGEILDERRVAQNYAALADAEKLVHALFTDKDRVIVASDHGDGACAAHTKHKHTGDHGHVFSEPVLHTMLCANFKIPEPDRLCSTASVYTLLTEGRLAVQPEVWARFPFYVDVQTHARIELDGQLKITVFVPDGLNFDPTVCYWCINGMLHPKYRGMKSTRVPKIGQTVTKFKEYRLWETQT